MPAGKSRRAEGGRAISHLRPWLAPAPQSRGPPRNRGPGVPAESRWWGAGSVGWGGWVRISWVGGGRLGSAEDALRHPHDQLELAPLVVPAEEVAADGGGEAALGA